MTFAHADFAFGTCNQDELIHINSGASLDESPVNGDYNLNNIKINFPTCAIKNIDSNIINLTNCKYYSIDGFYSLNKDNNFNIFHNNINGLESKFESLHQFIAGASEFDVIALTETSQKKKK